MLCYMGLASLTLWGGENTAMEMAGGREHFLNRNLVLIVTRLGFRFCSPTSKHSNL